MYRVLLRRVNDGEQFQVTFNEYREARNFLIRSKHSKVVQVVFYNFSIEEN